MTAARKLPGLVELQAQRSDAAAKLEAAKDSVLELAGDAAKFQAAKRKIVDLETEVERLDHLIAAEQARITAESRARAEAEVSKLRAECETRAFEGRINAHADRLVQLQRQVAEVVAALESEVSAATEAHAKAHQITRSLPCITASMGWAQRGPGEVGALEFRDVSPTGERYAIGRFECREPSYRGLALGVVLGRLYLADAADCTPWTRRVTDPGLPARLLGGYRAISEHESNTLLAQGGSDAKLRERLQAALDGVVTDAKRELSRCARSVLPRDET